MSEEAVVHPTPSRSQRRWWKENSVYQIYPSSFNDTNGDGIGDIPGIIEKLDYLHDLGVDVLWISPVYKSPGKDMGYDISDYLDINPQYGTMADIEALIAGAHQRGMKLLMDLVVNHTSDQHEWFLDSRSSKQSKKRDWYIWRDPRYDENGQRQPPNNWLAVFGGSVWEWDKHTGQYYLHCFLSSQPDLNWEQPEVRKAVHAVMKFWLDKKVDGFRQDVINLISKAPGLPDAPIVLPGEKFQPAYTIFSNGPRLHEFLQEMRREVLDKYDVMVVGEMPWLTDRKEVLKIVGAERGELDMIFQFDIVEMDFGNNGRFSWPENPWDLAQLKDIIEDWQTFMISHDGWNSVFIENHDHPRSVSRFIDRRLTDNDPIVRTRVCKMLATMCAGQSGTLYIFQGQELGMKNVPQDWDISEYKDIETQNKYKHVLEEVNGDKSKPSFISFMDALHLKARDHGRTPVQWDSSPHGGFTTGTPWMRVNDDYPSWNASLQVPDESSVRAHWKRILLLRKQYKDVLIYGDFEMLTKEDPAVVAYRRVYGKQQALVMLNFTNKEVRWEAPQEREEIIALLKVEWAKLKNYNELRIEGGAVVLRAFEAVMFIE